MVNLQDPDSWRVKDIYMFTDLYLERGNLKIREKGADLKWPPLFQELFLTLNRTRAALKEIKPDLSLPDAIKVKKGGLLDVVEDLWFCLYHVFHSTDTGKPLGAAEIFLHSCLDFYFDDSTPLILIWAFLYSHLLRSFVRHGDCVGKDQREEDKAINDALDLGGVPMSLDLDEIRPVEDDGELLGEGAQGEVYKRMWRDELVAVKEVSRAQFETFVESSSVSWGSKVVVSGLSLDKEVRILNWLKHPNVVELKGLTRKVKGTGKYGLVMELMDGTLEGLIPKLSPGRDECAKKSSPPNGGKYTAPGFFSHTGPSRDVQTIDILLQVARGMRFLHSSNVVHRDLKTTNVLIGFPDPSVPVDALTCLPHVRVKLADFGLAAVAAASSSSEEGDQESAYKLGTTFYMAPELRRHSQVPKDFKITEALKADVFSFGSICFRLATGKPPLPIQEFYDKIQQGSLSDFLSECPKYLVSLLERCWSADPKGRPDFSCICEELLSLKRHALLAAGFDSVSPTPSNWCCTSSERDRCLIPSNWWCTRSKPNRRFLKSKLKLPVPFATPVPLLFCSWQTGYLLVRKGFDLDMLQEAEVNKLVSLKWLSRLFIAGPEVESRRRKWHSCFRTPIDYGGREDLEVTFRVNVRDRWFVQRENVGVIIRAEGGHPSTVFENFFSITPLARELREFQRIRWGDHHCPGDHPVKFQPW